MIGQEGRREGGGLGESDREGAGSDLPLKSAGTRNFFLSMSGMLDLGTFSTITWSRGGGGGGGEQNDTVTVPSSNYMISL